MPSIYPNEAWTAELRKGTRDLHHQLDTHPLMRTLTSQSFDFSEYQESLAFMSSIWAPFAQRFLWARPLNRVLERECLVSTREITLPTFNDRTDELAWQYVMWGSTKGGRMLARHLQTHQANEPALTLNFFKACADVGGFPDLIDRPASDCLDSARHVFEYWLYQAEQHQVTT